MSGEIGQVRNIKLAAMHCFMLMRAALLVLLMASVASAGYLALTCPSSVNSQSTLINVTSYDAGSVAVGDVHVSPVPMSLSEAGASGNSYAFIIGFNESGLYKVDVNTSEDSRSCSFLVQRPAPPPQVPELPWFVAIVAVAGLALLVRTKFR